MFNEFPSWPEGRFRILVTNEKIERGRGNGGKREIKKVDENHFLNLILSSSLVICFRCEILMKRLKI